MADQQRVSQAAGWTAASRVISQLAQLVVFLFAARFLSTTDFGAFSLLSAVAMLMSRIGQGGWLELATSWRGSKKVEAHAFTLAMLSSIGLSLVGALASEICVRIDALEPYALLAMLLSLSVVAVGPGMYWSGLLLREQRGEALGKIVIISQVLGGMVAILGLAAGWRFVALGAGKLVTHLVETALTGLTARWFPAPCLSSEGEATIREYWTGMTGAKLIGYAEGYTATLLIGLFLGPAPVGLYRAAQRLVASIAETVGEPARIVCWMTLRQAVDNEQVEGGGPELTPEGARILGSGAERFLTLVTLLATPVFLGLAAASEGIVHVMLGERWSACTEIVAILAIARLLTLPGTLTLPLLSLLGRIEQIPKLAMVSGAATVIALPLSAPFGARWAAVGQLAATVCALLVRLYTYWRHGGVHGYRALGRAYASIAGSLAIVVVLRSGHAWVDSNIATSFVRMLLEITTGAATFSVVFTVLGGWKRLRESYSSPKVHRFEASQ